MKTPVLIFALATLVSAPAHAAHWTVDYAKSRLGFTVNWSNEPFSAGFKSWKADIDFDPAALSQARAAVVIDLASEASDEPDFDDGLKGAQGFQTSQFPQARFVTRSFVHKQGNDYVATGDLTIKGITRAVTLPFVLTFTGNSVHMTGTAHVIRTDFNVGLGTWSAPSPVSHDVTVTIDLVATRSS
ncbi:MAG: YceI family protein [Rhizomicrobium sp.]|jgi:polyisoprenoid-binding protein YceI